MITRRELEGIAKQKGLNLGQAEKNYLHFLILEIISKELPDVLVFKGGTALMICHNLNRFSEDLDFTAIDTDYNTVEKLKVILQRRIPRIEFESLEKTDISESFILRFQGPLYTGTRQTTSKIEIDISYRETIEEKTDAKRIISPYPDIPTFFLRTMSLKEIFAEKVRAIMTRNKARDVFDIEYLIALNIITSEDLINKKLAYYGQTYSLTLFKEKLLQKEKIWIPELRNLVTITPDFKEEVTTILRWMEKIEQSLNNKSAPPLKK